MKTFLTLLSLFFCLTLSAQGLTVESFKENTQDTSAKEFSRNDNNGVPCALIKVELASSSAKFEGTVMGKVEYKTSEYWVYMPKSSNSLTVKLKNYLPLPVEFEPLESKVTYVLVISGVVVNGQQKKARTKTGSLDITSTPRGASITIDGKLYGKTPFTVEELQEGSHSVSLSLEGYSTETKQVTITEGQTATVSATLQNGREITISTKEEGATIFIDYKEVGKSPYTGLLSFGNHIAYAMLNGNATSNQTIVASQGEGALPSIVLSFSDVHEYVDLGLSVKWATCNVGASSPEEYGDYYAWGETETKDFYHWRTYKWCKGSYDTQIKYCNDSEFGMVDNKKVLVPEDDVAHVKWGGSWRMPTDAEMTELREKCTWKWTTQGGSNGYKVTSKSNGNSIFLPAAGYRYGSLLDDAGSYGNYWSSSLCASGPGGAWDLSFSSGNVLRDSHSRYCGRSVRPVCSVPHSTEVKLTSIALDKSYMHLTLGDTYTLAASMNPSNASDKSFTWSSSDPSVATVDATGKVSAKKAGTATVMAIADDGDGVTATCTVAVIPFENVEGEYNGHKYVDLGLSVKWATCNVGASSPEEYGDYYAWGETETKNTYDWSTYKWCKGSYDTQIKYCNDSEYGTVDNKKVLDPEDDVAHVKWGGSWRMPTDAEMTELRKMCTWTWTTQGGKKGYKVTSKKNGNSIFLPAAGYRNDGSLYNAGSHGFYWSSSLDTSYSSDACYLCFNSDNVDRYSFSRYCDGLSVRPVCP